MVFPLFKSENQIRTAQYTSGAGPTLTCPHFYESKQYLSCQNFTSHFSVQAPAPRHFPKRERTDFFMYLRCFLVVCRNPAINCHHDPLRFPQLLQTFVPQRTNEKVRMQVVHNDVVRLWIDDITSFYAGLSRSACKNLYSRGLPHKAPYPCIYKKSRWINCFFTH